MSYQNATQSHRCLGCGENMPVARRSTYNPERMMLLTEAFREKHKNCPKNGPPARLLWTGPFLASRRRTGLFAVS